MDSVGIPTGLHPINPHQPPASIGGAGNDMHAPDLATVTLKHP